MKKVRRQAKDAVASAQTSVDAELAHAARRVTASTNATEVCIRVLTDDLAVVERSAASVLEMEAANLSLSASVASAARRQAQLRLLVRDLRAQLEAEEQRAVALEESIIERTLFETSSDTPGSRREQADEGRSSGHTAAEEIRMDTASSGYGAVQIGAWRLEQSPAEPGSSDAPDARHPRRSSGGGRGAAPGTAPTSDDRPQEQKGSKIGRKLSFGRTIRRSLSFA